MHRIHSGFTVAAEIKEGRLTNLQDQLRKYECKNMSDSPFAKSHTTLYVSGVALAKDDENHLPATLVFATTYYGPLSDHLLDIVSSCRAELCAIFKHCINFP